MRTPNVDQVLTVDPIGTASYACPPPTAGVSGLLPVSTTVVVDVPQWGEARLRPSMRQRAALGRITATGVGHGFSSDLGTGTLYARTPGAGRRTAAAAAAEQAGKRTNGTARTTENKQQLHLMSRRDPRTWRPPV